MDECAAGPVRALSRDSDHGHRECDFQPGTGQASQLATANVGKRRLIRGERVFTFTVGQVCDLPSSGRQVTDLPYSIVGGRLLEVTIYIFTAPQLNNIDKQHVVVNLIQDSVLSQA